MAKTIAELNEIRLAKKKKNTYIKNKQTDRLILTRHDSDSRFNNRIKKLTNECGKDGHGEYISHWYVGKEDINARSKEHNCDYSECCLHGNSNYKASNNIKLIHSGDVQLNFSLKSKRNMNFEEPVGLMNGVFRKAVAGDCDWLQHCVFFGPQDLEGNSNLFNHKDAANVYKANKDDRFVLDASQKGGLVKYVNSTCVYEMVNVKLYRVLMDGQWNCEYWTTKNIAVGELILSDYELNFDGKENERIIVDNLDEDEVKEIERFKKYRNCQCFKYGIEDCVNSSKNVQERERLERKSRRRSKKNRRRSPRRSKSRSRARSTQNMHAK